MKTFHRLAILLLCLLSVPAILHAGDPAPVMTGVSQKLMQGAFVSARSSAAIMASDRVAIQEGVLDGFIDGREAAARVAVNVHVSGLESEHAALLKGFAGFPGFVPGVSPTSVPFQLYETPLLTAPNVIYFPYNGKDLQIRYILTKYSGTGSIPTEGLPTSGAMITHVPLSGPLATPSSITWHYRKEVRVSVVVSSEKTQYAAYDRKGDTTAGSRVVTNLDSTQGLAAGVQVYGFGIPDGTTVTGITGNSITLSAAAGITMTQNFPGIGQRLTFVPDMTVSSVNPQECGGSDALGCASGSGSPLSGVRYYPADVASSVTLNALLQYSSESGVRNLSQVVVNGGGASPIFLSTAEKKTLTVISLANPLTVEWKYLDSQEFAVGLPMEPQTTGEGCAAEDDGSVILADVKPQITILSPDPSLPGDTVDAAFVWAWENSSPSSQRMRYFPIHPVRSFSIRWTCITDPLTKATKTFDESARTFWPAKQKHIMNAPVNLQPPDAVNSFDSVSFTTSGAQVALSEFNAPAPGTTVLRFVTPPRLPDLKDGTAFIVVETEEKPSNDVLRQTETPWLVGKKITNVNHTDPEAATKTGYLYYGGGVYDGSGPDKAYDRSTRKGAIIPVNVSPDWDLSPLTVVWYEMGQGNIGWPTTPKRYRAVWEYDPAYPATTALTIGTGIPVSPTSRPKAMVYNQPDTSLPGCNPNEEHALLTGDTLYALRDDLNAVNALSSPYVLLKYFNPSANEWMMDVYQVVRPSAFTYTVDAGTPIVAPLPGSFQIPPDSDIKKIGEVEEGGQWHLRDHKGGHWAKAANWSPSDQTPKPEGEKSRFVMQWHYYMRADFYWPFVGTLEKKEGDVLPFLNDSGAGQAYQVGVKPIDVTYVTIWPTGAPSLLVGDTLTRARGGLPDLYNFMSAEVIFDENVYNGGGPLAKLYAPERYLYYLYAPAAGTQLNLLEGIKTEAGEGGGLTFPELPFAVQSRLFYDPINNQLGFKGVWISNEGETPWLLPNLMTAAEMKTIGDLSSSGEWNIAAKALYCMSRNPNGVAGLPSTTAVCPDTSDTSDTSQSLDPITSQPDYSYAKWGIGLGLDSDANGKIVSARSIPGEKNALTAGMAQGEGYVVIAENNHEDLGDAPVQLHVIRVGRGPDGVYRGVVKAIKSKNVFDEKLTLHYTGDFGGEPEKFTFEWYYKEAKGEMPSLPPAGRIVEPIEPTSDEDETNLWTKYIDPANAGGSGQTDVTIQGASPLTLSDNWFAVRYYYKDAWPAIAETSVPDPPATPHDDDKNWSNWSGANFDEPMLAVGWIKRVIDGLNPLEARVTNFRNNATNTTVSMLSQFGTRYEGAIALNSEAGNLNSLGLISAYETVLNRARLFSIDAVPPQGGSVNAALLNVSSRLATFYLALGNEAYADAVDPTIGFSTKSAEYGNMAPSIFSFQNQLDSLLDEELVLMRGRDDTATTTKNPPYYNRLIWNFTQGEGEIAYAQNYNVTDQDSNGLINAGDARSMYPQGHGDAWGHYLQGISYYYRLLGHPAFTWEPRVEFVLVAGNPVMVDYLDERKFATIAAARAKTGAEILDLTYRKFYTDDPAGQWQGYKDTYTDRAWGVDEWARRAGQGAYFDWITANAVLPESIPEVAIARKQYVQDANGGFKEEWIPGADIQQINRGKVPELNSIASQFHRIQAKMTEVDNGVNPLGLVKGVVPFDIDPVQISAGQTHFEQIYERAAKAVENAINVYDYANGYTQRLRQNQDTLEQFKKNLGDQERDYKNRLIEVFGYPYADDIGAGETYPDGYDGPDIWHYNYVDRTELTGDKSGSYTSFTATLSDPASLEKLTGLGAFSETTNTVSFHVSTDNHWLVKPSEWTTKRRAPGKIQQALSELLVAQASYDKSLQKFNGLVGDIEWAKDNLQARYNLLSNQILLMDGNAGNQLGLDIAINLAHAASIAAKRVSEEIDGGFTIALESTPKVVGMASDVTSTLRGTMKAAEVAGKSAFDIAGDIADQAEFTLGTIKERLQAGMELQITKSEANWELNQQLAELESMVSDVDQQLLETYLLKETVQQTAGKYQAALAEGLRLMDERMEKRTQAAAEVQEYRFQDLGFRVFRNDAIQKYRAQFDLATKYVYLAATAYDYETNLLGTASGSGRKFLEDITRQSSLGVFSNGKPMAGFPGLADIMARLSQNFAVYKTQLGFNNPQTETTPFSLRTELFRIKGDTASTGAWRDVLKDHRVDDLWKIPEFKRFCRPFAPESAGPQPGIVIKFPTTITYGKNFFGWPLSGGDSAYSSSNYSTRVRSVGVWFQNYNSAGLSSTPRVYLVPVGADILRSPTGDGFATREWQVRDQVLPVPFPIGDSDLRNPSFIPANDSLSGEFSGIRRLSDFRAYPYSGAFNPSQTTSDSRLIGRSVWNTEWMMIIPASTLLFNKEVGLNNFINSVDDIKMFFQTYAYSGN